MQKRLSSDTQPDYMRVILFSVLFAAWIWIASWWIQHFMEVWHLSPFYISIWIALSFVIFAYKENLVLSGWERRSILLIGWWVFVALFVISFALLSMLWVVWHGHADGGHDISKKSSHHGQENRTSSHHKSPTMARCTHAMPKKWDRCSGMWDGTWMYPKKH
jgi:hypothetical protein